MDLGWGIWDFLFAVLIIGAGAKMIEKNTLFSGKWILGLVLVLLSAWTIFYIIQFAFSSSFIPADVPLQYTDVAEGIGRYFLNIFRWGGGE